LFISAGLTSLRQVLENRNGIALANVRTVPIPAEDIVKEMIARMKECGFLFPIGMGTELLNLPPDPHRLSIASFSGMNLVAHGVELGFSIKTEIGAGTIPFSRIENST
jgi:hypothetical protein